MKQNSKFIYFNEKKTAFTKPKKIKLYHFVLHASTCNNRVLRPDFMCMIVWMLEMQSKSKQEKKTIKFVFHCSCNCLNEVHEREIEL